ncbi:SWIM zinc finger family protein [Saccharopolyspora phatthalungensis]|uniref:Putative Zn finger protein n=1 Tax=Saccharopolyspora phatthalungensis TaxID=664693 RepID=A0A840Q8V2_9PSEU|nr:SWIM zinc finger family protein [Saccharopolyspora phatthalungensis]MBB5156171.1 putative Zn finger protein [Saccharopolyspora phatthalungensis]
MNSWRGFPPAAKPIRVEGGIKARSKRGEIAQTWWSRRFIEVLESFGMGGRLQRGKRYARAGQVLNLTLSTSVVVGLVQGSRPEPYRARIAIKAFTAAEWERIERELAGQALYAAKLLAGEMPTDIERIFDEVGLQLFPVTMRELTMDCSCPDWEIPCKHLAAACYLLAESFDEDPFQILAWRGRGREELLDRLRALRGTVAGPAAKEPDDAAPLSECLETFWTAPEPLASATGPEPEPTVPDALLDELEPLPVKIGNTNAVEALRPAYRAMSRP